MIIHRPEVKVGDRFANHDWLKRTKQAHHLSRVVTNNPDPLVIAVDGGWGSGKSHFLKLWVAEHEDWLKQNQHSETLTTVIYFDAFKYDYLDDPLASLVFQLEKKFPKNEMMETIKQSGILLSKVGLSYLTVGVSDNLLDHLKKQQQYLWKNEYDRIEAIDDFIAKLGTLAEGNKLVFIVDELDRCRPDYALKLLEIIKHFFEVDNVHFILGANFTALESSVNAAYGKGIDETGYLKKFINVRMQFLSVEDQENPSITLNYFDGFKKYLEGRGHPLSENTFYGYKIVKMAKEILAIPTIAGKLRLRDIDRLFDRLSLIPKNYKPSHTGDFNNNYYFPSVFIFALVLEAINRRWLDKLIDGTLDSDTISELFDTNSNDELSKSIYSFCCLLANYSENLVKNHRYDASVLNKYYDGFSRENSRYHREKLRNELKQFLSEFEAFEEP